MNEIEDLQARLAFQEDTIQSLNKEVAALSQQILGMQQQMKHLYKKLDETVSQLEQSQGQASAVLLDEERPPHY